MGAQRRYKDPINRTITIEVDHFSVYGVFVKSDEIDDSNNSIEDPGKEHSDNEDPSGKIPNKKNPSEENPTKENIGKEDASKENPSKEDLDKEKKSKVDKVKVKVEDESSKEDKKLPKTATNIFNLMFFGFALLVLGST